VRPTASLDGPWTIELEPGTEPVEIRVPFTFESRLSGLGLAGEIHERVRYRRTFRVPERWRGSRVLLRFGAVDWRARVLVDGRHVGTHTGGYTSFRLDLGPLDAGVEHELVVEVEDPADGPQPRGKQRAGGGIWYTRATGIWQPVALEAVADPYIERVDVDVAPDGTLDVRVATSGPTEVRVRAPERIDRRWSPESPHLVQVAVDTASGDSVETHAAWRTIERRGSQILLNGEQRFLRGVLDQGYWPDGVYTAPGEAALRADVEAARAMGFDLARKHVKVEDERWYDWCDRLGLLVAQDVPSSHDLSTGEARAGFVREVEEIVAQLRRHPCVVAWILFNEDWGAPPPDFQRELVAHVRRLDPTRLVIDASGWHHRGDTDVLDVHDYGDDLSRHAAHDGAPLVVGECGGVSLVPPGAREDFAYKHVASGAELAEAYERHVDTIGDDVAGFVWTQLTDVEGELNGLYTSDRTAKADPEMIRAVNERRETRR
jgi:beta-galactosidase/beta-glucuronidase